jgi:translation initiation factor IF-1
MVVAAPADINAFLRRKAMHLVLMNEVTFTGKIAARGESLQYTRIAESDTVTAGKVISACRR